MPDTNWHDQNKGRAYPFVEQPVLAVAGPLSHAAVTDFGGYTGPDETSLSAELQAIEVGSGAATLRFACGGSVFSFTITPSDAGNTLLADEASSERGDAFITVGDPDALLALPAGTYAVTRGAVEPALVVAEYGSKVTGIGLAEDPGPLEGNAVFSYPLQAHVIARDISGVVKLVPGYNAGLSENGNSIEIRPLYGAGEGVPCVFDFRRGVRGEAGMSSSSSSSSAAAQTRIGCNGLIYTINGVGPADGEIVNVEPGAGVAVQGGRGWLRVYLEGRSVFDRC